MSRSTHRADPRADPRAGWQRQLVLILVVCAGAGALSWEVLWHLHITLAVGVSAVGTAITLAVTMLGMTAGALAMGRLLAEHPVENPIRLYGRLELVVGLSGLAMPLGFRLVSQWDALVYAASPELAPVLQVVAIALVLGPPTLAMGATLPVFPLLARTHGVPISLLYGLNTAGAAIGVLLISMGVLPAVGASTAGLLLAAVSATIFACTFVFRVDEPVATREGPDPIESNTAPALSPAVASLLVFSTGFATFGLEVAWFRSLRAAFQATSETFAIILASVLLPLAIGARGVPWLRGRGIHPAMPLACAGVAILLVTPLVERVDLMVFAMKLHIGDYVRRLAVTGAILAPPMVCLGAVLPWCLEAMPRPAQVARLYAINTLASVLGSLVAAWVLLPTLGFARTAWLLGSLVVLVAMVTGPRPLARVWAATGGAVALALAVGTTASLGRDRVQVMDMESAPHRLIAFREGPDATIAVVEDRRGEKQLVIDGFVASGANPLASYMEWMGRLPMLLHDDPRSALVICFGTGETAHSLRDEGPERLDIVDINRAVYEMAPHFDRNRGVLQDERVNAIVMDGRAWMRRDPTRYDVVTLEPMPPHFAGVNALYSVEFYQSVAERLEPGGVVAQWVPFHILPLVHAASIAATFQAVFPDAGLWVDPFSKTGILIGRRQRKGRALGESWPGLARGDVVRALSDDEIRAALDLDARGLAHFASLGEIITDDNQLLSYSLMSLEIARKGTERLVSSNIERVAQSAAATRTGPES